MKIRARDGKTYEVHRVGNAETFEVWRDSDHVGGFVLDGDATRVSLTRGGAGKTTEATMREVAGEFVERGGGGMRMM